MTATHDELQPVAASTPAGRPLKERTGPVVVFAAFIGLWYLI